MKTPVSLNPFVPEFKGTAASRDRKNRISPQAQKRTNVTAIKTKALGDIAITLPTRRALTIRSPGSQISFPSGDCKTLLPLQNRKLLVVTYLITHYGLSPLKLSLKGRQRRFHKACITWESIQPAKPKRQ